MRRKVSNELKKQRSIFEVVPVSPAAGEGRIIGERCYVKAYGSDVFNQSGVYAGERFIPFLGDRICVKADNGVVHFVEPHLVSFF